MPYRVVAVDEMMARIDRGGTLVDVSLLLMSEDVQVGDYLIVQAQRHAVARMDATEATVRLNLFAEIVDGVDRDGAEAAE